MLLQEITINLTDTPVPPDIANWIKEADRRADEFYAEGLGIRYPKYIQSDPTAVYRAIESIRTQGILDGNIFCEWGCGLGIATGAAALLGMEAYGIEIETELVDRAIKLAADLNVPSDILETSYLPDGFEESEGHGGKDLIAPDELITIGRVEYTATYDGLDPGEVSLFYVYPWPDQEEMMMDLFHAVASPDAILLMYLGDGELATYANEEE